MIVPFRKCKLGVIVIVIMLLYFDYEMVTFSVWFSKNLLISIFTKTYSSTPPPPPPPFDKEVHMVAL